MGAVMSEETLAALGKFDDSIQRLKAGASAAKNVLGTVLLPELQVLADEGVSLIGEFTQGMLEAEGDWTKISEVIGNTVGGFAAMIMENLPSCARATICCVAFNICTIQTFDEITDEFLTQIVTGRRFACADFYSNLIISIWCYP